VLAEKYSFRKQNPNLPPALQGEVLPVIKVYVTKDSSGNIFGEDPEYVYTSPKLVD